LNPLPIGDNTKMQGSETCLSLVKKEKRVVGFCLFAFAQNKGCCGYNDDDNC
jgi:hypothetical protein